MIPSTFNAYDWEPCNHLLGKTADTSLISMTGHGNSDVVLTYPHGTPKGSLVQRIPVISRLGFNLFSLKVVNNKRHDFICRVRGEISVLNDHLVFPLRGNTYQASGYRIKHSIRPPFAGSAIIVRGHEPSSTVDINVFH